MRYQIQCYTAIIMLHIYKFNIDMVKLPEYNNTYDIKSIIKAEFILVRAWTTHGYFFFIILAPSFLPTNRAGSIRTQFANVQWNPKINLTTYNFYIRVQDS